MKRGGKLQERYLYVSTVAQSSTDPDFIAVIGADPRRKDFGKIVNRIDMPNVGDELHHYGYSADQKRLLVPGLFSSRMHVFDVKGGGKQLTPQDRQRPGREERLRRPARRHGAIRRPGPRDDDRGGHRHHAPRRDRRDRRQDGRVRTALRPGAVARARPGRAAVHVRLRVAARGEPRDQHDVRLARSVRGGHRSRPASATTSPSGTCASAR